MSTPPVSGSNTPVPGFSASLPPPSAGASSSSAFPSSLPPPSALPHPPPPPPFNAPAVPPPPKRVPVPTGIYPVDSIKTIAESIGINKLDETVAVALAGDVEFRIHHLIEEAQKFMRHSRRSTMLPSDINHALQSLNVEPLYGHLPLPSSSPAFIPIRTSAAAIATSSSKSSSSDQFYYLQDQEISFDQLLKTKPPGLVGGGVRWTAHWLAVEGVMPRVPENVATDYHKVHVEVKEAKESGGKAGSGVAAALVKAGGGGAAGPKLSQELQLYFTRLTKALLPEVGAGLRGKDGELSPVERARLAALASLRGDTGLQGLVVYLVRWIGEKITESLHHLSDLPPLLDTIHALLSNQTLFLEPYLHQILPPLLSPLLTSPLGSPSPTTNGASSSSKRSSEPSTSEIRSHAAQVLGVLVNEFGSVYETLIPRLTKTLLRSLAPPNPAGRVEGALLGLGAIGKEGVRRGLWGSSSLSDEGASAVRSWGESWEREEGWSYEERERVVRAGVSTLHFLLPNPVRQPAYPISPLTDSSSLATLQTAFGYAFATEIGRDRWLAESLLDLISGRDTEEYEQEGGDGAFDYAHFDFGGEGGMMAVEEDQHAEQHEEGGGGDVDMPHSPQPNLPTSYADSDTPLLSLMPTSGTLGGASSADFAEALLGLETSLAETVAAGGGGDRGDLAGGEYVAGLDELMGIQGMGDEQQQPAVDAGAGESEAEGARGAGTEEDEEDADMEEVS